MTHRCPACGVTQPGDTCTRDECGHRSTTDPVELARLWLARIRNQLNDKGDNQ